MEFLGSKHEQKIESLSLQGHTKQKLVTMLLAEGHTLEEATELATSIRKLQNERRSKKGIHHVLVGTGVLVFGFMFTVFCYHAGYSLEIPLYGITLIGLGIALYGTYEILD